MHAELAKQQALQPKPRTSRPVRQQQRLSLTGFLIRVGLFYLALAYVVVCPQDANRDRAVCRSLDAFQARALEYRPVVQPYLDKAKAQLEPHWDHYSLRAEPYLKKVRPHARKAQAWARPRVLSAIEFYKAKVHPRALKGISNIRAHSRPLIARGWKLYNTTLAPSVEWYTHEAKGWYARTAQPHVSKLQSHATTHGQAAYGYLAPVYFEGVPKAARFYQGTLAPTAVKTYRQGEKMYLNQVHPKLVVGYGHGASFVRSKVLPSAHRFYSLYIAPQLDKIKERIFEYRAKHSEAEAAQRVIDLENKKLRDAELDDFADFVAELREEHASTAEPVAPATQTFIPPPPHPSGEEPSLAEVAAERAAKRTTLETLSTTYEKEIVRLGHVEHDLLHKRLIQIREEALDDVPKRFGAAVSGLDDEGDKFAGRLSRYFAKVLEDDKTPIESKVADSDFLAKKALIKVKHLADQILAEAADYRKTLDDKEQHAVVQASSALIALVGKAQEEIGYGWTWFDGTTYKDWQRYHGLAKAQAAWVEQYEQLRSGELEDSILPTLDPNTALVEVESSVQQLQQAFETILSQIKIKGQHEIKGEWTGVANEAHKAAAAAGDKLAAVAEAVRASASSVVGATAVVTPSDLAGTASSLASVAKESVASAASEVAEALPTIPAVPAIPTDYLVEPIAAAASSASSAVESAYAEASQAVYRAVGQEPIPTDIHQSATSLINLASKAAASASASAASLAQRAVGQEPAPTDLAGSASSVASVASSAAVAAQASVLQAVQQAVSGEPIPLASAASIKAAHAYGEASQAALRAVGQEPSPTDGHQSATSIRNAASSAVLAASASVLSVVGEAQSALAGMPEAASSAVVAAPESVKSARSAAASVVDSIVDDSASSAVSLAGEGYSSASSAASSLAAAATSLIAPAPVRAQLSAAASAASAQFEHAAEAVDSAAAHVSQEAVRAVGGEPSPTDVRQVVTSAGKKLRRKAPASKASGAVSQASSVVSQVIEAAESVASRASEQADGAVAAATEAVAAAAEAVGVPHVEL